MPSNPTIVFTGPKVAALDDRPVPQPRAGELLIKTTRSLISTGTELTIFSGEFPPQSFWANYGKYPFDAGYSNVGVVIEAGPGVDPSWKGRRVVSGRPHAAYVIAGIDAVDRVPDGVSDDQAGFFSIARIVMNGVRRSSIQWGESVAVYGLGLLGQLCVRFCALSGARPVMGVDIAEKRLGLLPPIPAVTGIHAGKEDPAARVSELTRGRMADVVFEVTGNQNVIVSEFSLLKKAQGRFVVLSSPRGPTSFDFHDLCNAPSHTIIGAHAMSHPEHETSDNVWTLQRNTELFFELLRAGEVNVDDLITHRLPGIEGPAMYGKLLADRSAAMGVVLEWG